MADQHLLHLIHLMHFAVMISYVLISIDFFIGFLYNPCKKGKMAFFLLSTVFILCGATRFLLEYEVYNVLNLVLTTLLLAAAVGFWLAGVGRTLITYLQDEEEPDRRKGHPITNPNRRKDDWDIK